VPRPTIPIAQPMLGDEERTAVDRVLASGRLAQGPEVEAFEGELANELAGTREAVALSSGTAALELSILALGLGAGAEIITTPFTFAATVNAALRAGVRVRFADVGDDHNLDPEAAAEALSERTALVIPVHLYGLPAKILELSRLRVPVLEDAAQAHLATVDGKKVGSLGIAACFSFYASKNMTTGEGGAITTDDVDLALRVRVLRDQGMRGSYDYRTIGVNARMTEVAAAIGRVQLRRLPEWTAARRRSAALYLDALDGIDGICLPAPAPGVEPAWHVFTIQLEHDVDRDRVVAELDRDGVQARAYYPMVLADAEPYRNHPLVDATMPLDRARAAARSVVSLPVHPGIDAGIVERVAGSVERAVLRARGERR
jgi:perosamine synthetase